MPHIFVRAINIGPRVTGSTTFTKTTGTAVTITLPPANVGDLRVVAIGTLSSNVPSTPPTGWTKLQDNGSWWDSSIALWSRVKAAGDADTLTTSTAGYSTVCSAIAVTISNTSGVNVSALRSSAGANVTPHLAPAVTTTATNTVLLHFVFARDQTAPHTWPGSLAPIDAAINTSTMSAAYQSVSTSGVQEAVSATPATASQYTAVTVAAAK